VTYDHLLTHSHVSLPFLPFAAPAPPVASPLSLHDALPISQDVPHHLFKGEPVFFVHRQQERRERHHHHQEHGSRVADGAPGAMLDRKSTRLNSSHVSISYAVFCLKKNKVKASGHIHVCTQ